MGKRERSWSDGRKEKGKRKADDDVEIISEEEEDDPDLDDWCFVCKDGGKLRCCDYPNCDKPYHYRCVGQRKSFLKPEAEYWQCARHSCIRCKGIPSFTCYTCPIAICDQCLHASEVFRIGDENGFCDNCMKLVLYIEGETKQKPSLIDRSAYNLFEEYYKLVKTKYGVTLGDLQAGKMELKRGEKSKSSSLDKIGGFQKRKVDSSKPSQDERVINDKIRVPALVPANGGTLNDLQVGEMGLKTAEKRESSSLVEIGGLQKKKLDSSKPSQNERMINDKIRVPDFVPANGGTLDDLQAGEMGLKTAEKRKSSSLVEIGGLQKRKLDSIKTTQYEREIDDKIWVPALVPANVKLIYLTRKVIEKLLMQPESFEDKVKRTFVAIELPRKAGSNKIDRQLVQVTGITKTSCDDGQISIMLQAKNMPTGISIDRVSDLDFSEIVCKDLQQQVKDGLIEMPSFDELERMARGLSEVIVDDFIAREERKLQTKMNRAHEMGRKQEFIMHEADMKTLGNPHERSRLIRIYRNVSIEEQGVNTMSGRIINETQEIKGSSEIGLQTLSSQTVGPRSLSENMEDDKKQRECCPKLNSENLELSKDKSADISPPVKKKACVGQSVNAANEPVQKIDEVLSNVADHSSGQSFAVESECNILTSSREVLEHQTRVDVMHEEFENYGNKSCAQILLVKDKHDEVKQDDELLSFKGMRQEDLSLIYAKLYSMEAQLDRVVQKIDKLGEKAAQEAILLSYNKKSDIFMNALNLQPLVQGTIESFDDGLAPERTTEEKPSHCPEPEPAEPEPETNSVQPPDN